MATAGLTPPVHLLETSPALRARQAERLPEAEWCMDLVGLPEDGALLIVANEFFDALPIRQLVKTAEGWRERLVACQDTLFLPVVGNNGFDAIIPPQFRDVPDGSILETSPASVAIVRALANRIVATGGAALIVDYGYDGPAIGDSFQAVRGHAYVNPFEAPGEADLTAHVDFGTLAEAARVEGATVHGPVEQGAFLKALGIDARAGRLGGSAPADRDRLVEDMGSLFKVVAIVHPDWPAPAGFA
jgi:NADH dehydrogenase [ubiquinone] 1 alpha subcomplex assembly factor 7